VRSNFGHIIASPAQSRNQLEDRRGKNDKMSRKVWKAMKTSIRKIEVAKTKR